MKGIIINSDVDGILRYIGRDDALPTTVKDIEDFPKEFEGTQVTDYFLNVAEQILNFPSERFQSYISKYHQKTENDEVVDYSNNVCAKAALCVFCDPFGHD